MPWSQRVNAENQDFIFHLVFRKLPETLRLEFSKKVGGMECFILKLLLSLLREHVNIASDVGYLRDLPIKEEQYFYESSKLIDIDAISMHHYSNALCSAMRLHG